MSDVMREALEKIAALPCGACIARAALAAQPESCICAAIRMPDGEVIYGHRHNHCYDVVRARAGVDREDIVKAAQGFVTSAGRFVGREEAMDIQRVSGKPSCYRKDGSYSGELLFSEDLYANPTHCTTKISEIISELRKMDDRRYPLHAEAANAIESRDAEIARLRQQAGRFLK